MRNTRSDFLSVQAENVRVSIKSGTTLTAKAAREHSETVVNGRPDDTAANQVHRLMAHRDRLQRDLIKANRARDNRKAVALQDQLTKAETRIRYLAGSCYSKTAEYDQGRAAAKAGLKPDPDKRYSDAWFKGYREGK